MRLHKAKRRYGAEINMAPLIDVVFLLIIFFMCVSQFTRIEVENLKLPEARAGEEEIPGPSGPVIVNVHEDGRIVYNGADYVVAALGAELKAKYKDTPPEALPPVVIRGDRRLEWRKAAEIMKACAGAGLGRVRVAVVDKQ
jgi:biopolymer transport protein ExbD